MGQLRGFTDLFNVVIIPALSRLLDEPMKIMLRKMLLLGFLALFTNGVLANPPAAFEGRRFYVSYCLLCHGNDGKGGGPLAKAMKITPADLSTTVRSRSDTILTKIITGDGKQTITGRDRHNLLSETMPEWKNVFDADQIQALIAYLRFLSRKKHDLMGDPEHGLELYQKYCQVCHGVEGDGDGIMTNLIGIMPMDHTNPNETNSLDNQELMNSILDGKGRYMPAWKGILNQSDVEALVSYIRLLSF
ncbi:MAG: c-type cytochrome [Gammaproteobacteria bacterium]|nr:c-type cytochrome [Gammaproteobacteria bacterium]